MPAPLVVFGLQRTGTNLVKRALVDACDAYEANGEHDGLGWKHGPIERGLIDQPIDGQQQRVVLCVRDPYAWLVSCWNYFVQHKGADTTICEHFQRGWSFDQFVRRQHYVWPSPCARWNSHTGHGWQLIEDLLSEGRPAAIVRAEDLVTPDGQLEQLARLVDTLGLDIRVGGTLRAVSNRVDNRGRITGRRYDQAEYERRVRSCWTSPLRKWAAAQIDRDLADLLGY